MKRLAGLCALLLALSSTALAEPPLSAPQLVHYATKTETLEALARSYLGSEDRAALLAATNALGKQEAVLPGTTLRIPHTGYLRLGRKTPLSRLAKTLLGERYREFALRRLNPSLKAQVAKDTVIAVPYVLTHRYRAGETLEAIATRYGLDTEGAPALIRRYNAQARGRLRAGTTLLIPLLELRLTSTAQRRLASTQHFACKGDKGQALRTASGLPELRALMREGRYAAALGRAAQQLGEQVSQGGSVAELQLLIGTSYIALGDREAALLAFDAALAEQPELSLDEDAVSPRVRAAFEEARKRR